MTDLVTRKRIGNSVDKQLYNELKKVSENTKIPMSKLLDEGIEYIIKKYGGVENGQKVHR